MNEVVVLISSYNGQEFIREQIDSIFEQKEVSVRLIIRDDGSTDDTVSIIEEYKQKFENNIVLIRGENIGWKKSFFYLLMYASQHYNDFNYFAFADQDDIWLEEKLDKAVHALESNMDMPALYCSNLFYYKNGINHGKIQRSLPKVTYKSCLVRNYATGCTMVFNRKLLDLVSKQIPTVSVAHDYWLYQVAVLCGGVIIDENAYILYRQHDNNQIGCKPGLIDVWSRRLKNLRSSLNSHQREIVAKQLVSRFGDQMAPEARKAVEKIAFYRNSIHSQFSLMLDNGYTLGKASNDLWLKFRILLRIL